MYYRHKSAVRNAKQHGKLRESDFYIEFVRFQLPSTSQPPSTSDEGIEILNAGEISTPIIAPSDSNSRLDEFEEYEMLFNDMFDVLGTATVSWHYSVLHSNMSLVA